MLTGDGEDWPGPRGVPEALQVAGAARLLELLVLELLVLTASSTARELEHVALTAVARVGGWRLGVT